MTSCRSAHDGVVRRIAIGIGALCVITLAAMAWSLIVEPPEPRPAPAGRQAGWGHEALDAPHAQVRGISLIPVANACGLGASSCFKCHNGKRAAAPKMDKESSPWHTQHKTVNNSCVGCHEGNARIIKKEMSHAGLVSDPRTKPEMCGSCHKSDDPMALLQRYQKTKQ